MKDIWELAISAPVLPMTILLVPIGLYWLLSMLGIVDLEFLDVDFDADTDGGDDAQGLGFLQSMLKIVNASDIPVMIVLSFLIIILWTVTMVGNQFFNPEVTTGIGGMVAVGALVVSIILTRLIIKPLKPFFRLLKQDEENHVPVLGRTGAVRSAVVDASSGQVEVQNKEAPLLLNARTVTGSPPISRGTEILVVSHDSDTGLYFVRANHEPSHPTSS